MVNSISSAQSSYASEAAQSTAPKTQQQPQTQQKSTSPLPSDSVTLKSTGNADLTGEGT
jgi:hypothetical protein